MTPKPTSRRLLLALALSLLTLLWIPQQARAGDWTLVYTGDFIVELEWKKDGINQAKRMKAVSRVTLSPDYVVIEAATGVQVIPREALVELKWSRDGAGQENLEAAIETAINLLEAKNYELFIRKLCHPDELKKILEKASLAKLGEALSGEKSAELLKVLKSLKDQKPDMDDSGVLASFPVESSALGKKRMIFQKVGGSWYMLN